MQNTHHEITATPEEFNTIRTLDFLWPLVRTKNVIHKLVKLLMH